VSVFKRDIALCAFGLDSHVALITSVGGIHTDNVSDSESHPESILRLYNEERGGLKEKGPLRGARGLFPISSNEEQWDSAH